MNSAVTLNGRISEYVAGDPVRFHMPGHKGKYPVCGSCDVTELPQTFDLYSKDELCERVFSETAARFGAGMTLYSCGGATLALQTAIFACARRGRMLVSEVHKSVSFAMALCETEPVHFVFGDDIVPLLDGADAVLITTEDYYGRIAPDIVREYAAVCRAKRIPLICDNSHGTHLAFYKEGNLHPIGCGADIVIDSAHKTIPALTGGAFLHLCGKYSASWREFVEAMEVFGSSSPSFLIAASLEWAARYMDSSRAELAALAVRLEGVRNRLRAVGCSFLDNSDPFRLTIFAGNAREIDAHLCSGGIISEFSDDNAVVLIPSIMNTGDDYEALCDRMKDINVVTVSPPAPGGLRHVQTVSPHEALFAKKRYPGVAVRPVYAYPPGIAVTHIGESEP